MTSLVDDLSGRDLETLAGITGSEPAELLVDLQRKPWHVHDLLSNPDVFDSILDRHAPPAQVVSPILLFAVLIHRASDELRDATYVHDWAGPKSRLPVFDVEPLREYLEDPGRLVFLAKLLASFAVPEPLPIPEDDPFDLVALAAWLDAVPDRTALLRRLGDLALFSAGVFPDRAATRPLRPIDAERLGRGIGMSPDEIIGLCDTGSTTPGFVALETLGARWYSVAYDDGGQPPVVVDVAHRFTAARRVLNHLSDRYLNDIEPNFPLAS